MTTQTDTHAEYYAAMEADNAWQAELDRRGINRYTLAARGETGSTLRELYEAKVAADKARAEAAGKQLTTTTPKGD